jgi:hypothetical protein
MDKLKRQLLGKGAAMPKAAPPKKKPPQPSTSATDGPLDDDNSDEGRVDQISKAAPKGKSRNARLKSIEDNSSDDNKPRPASKKSKRNSSFLDEVLSTKKKRKKQG